MDQTESQKIKAKLDKARKQLRQFNEDLGLKPAPPQAGLPPKSLSTITVPEYEQAAKNVEELEQAYKEAKREERF